MDVALIKYWDLIDDRIAQVRETTMGGMGHAGEFETSMMMYLHPELVNRKAIAECPPAKGDPYYQADLIGKKRYGKFISFDKYDKNGNLGQAQFANAEKGKVFFEAAANAVARFFDFWCSNTEENK
jgi:creatinine amidohydrolase